MAKKTQLDEILEVVRFVKDNAVTREEFTREICDIKSQMVTKKELEEKLGGLERRFDDKLGGLETRMVTKAYLDEKLLNLKGDMVTMIRTEGAKLTTLVQILGVKKVLSHTDQRRVLTASR